MSIFHLNAKVISRAHGRSSTASSAYRAGQKIKDERTGQAFNYERKKEVVYREIFAPKNVPAWVFDRSSLWNEVEKCELRKDAQVAREVEVSLPVELSRQQQIILLERFIKTQFVSQGMVADVCIHDKPGNPHAHILLTTRDISSAGFGQKNRSWNDKSQLVMWRSEWASHTNRRLSIAGLKCRIDHRSLQAQGIDRIPTVHVSPKNIAMQAKGLPVFVMQLNHYIKEKNMNEKKREKVHMSGEPISPAQAKRVINKPFISAPLNMGGFDRRSCESELFNQSYWTRLNNLFGDLMIPFDRYETDLGPCLRFKLETGAVYDYGTQMSCDSGGTEEIQLMVSLAKEKGWTGIHLSGSDEFKEKVFFSAVLSGAFKPEQIGGYIPSHRANLMLELAGMSPNKHKPFAKPAESIAIEHEPNTNKKNKI